MLSGSSFVGHPTGIQVAGGVLWVTDHESTPNTNRIIRYALSGTTLSAPVTATVPFADPLVYDAGANAIYTAALGVEKLNATTLNGLATVIASGRGPGQTNEPLGLTQFAGGDLVVAQGDDVVKRFTTAGAEVWKAGVNEHATGVVLTAEGLSVAANGDLLVATQGTQQITRFNTAGAFVSRFGPTRPGRGFPHRLSRRPTPRCGWVTRPAASSTSAPTRSCLGDRAGDLGQAIVAVDGHGQVDELGLASQVVRRFDVAGTLLGSFGSSGTGPGQMSNAQSLVAGADGTIAIADAGNHRVDLFRADGTLVRSFGSAGTGPASSSSCAASRSTARVICSPWTRGSTAFRSSRSTAPCARRWARRAGATGSSTARPRSPRTARETPTLATRSSTASRSSCSRRRRRRRSPQRRPRRRR